MADTSAIGASSAASGAVRSGAGAATSRATIAQNFDTFLQLLTTQLKNQNPLDPLDTNQFTQQLVQFAQVEQQMNTNTALGTLIEAQRTGQATAALGFLGATVTIDGDTANLANSQATWRVSASNSGTATV